MPIPIRPSDEILKFIDEHFYYEPESGNLYKLNTHTQEWNLVSPDIWFNDKIVNTPIANICWYLFYREWPNKEVDHKDVNPSNNKMGNLRLANRRRVVKLPADAYGDANS